jgi:hypothetical protein
MNREIKSAATIAKNISGWVIQRGIDVMIFDVQEKASAHLSTRKWFQNLKETCPRWADEYLAAVSIYAYRCHFPECTIKELCKHLEVGYSDTWRVIDDITEITSCLK